MLVGASFRTAFFFVVAMGQARNLRFEVGVVWRGGRCFFRHGMVGFSQAILSHHFGAPASARFPAYGVPRLPGPQLRSMPPKGGTANAELRVPRCGARISLERVLNFPRSPATGPKALRKSAQGKRGTSAALGHAVKKRARPNGAKQDSCRAPLGRVPVRESNPGRRSLHSLALG